MATDGQAWVLAPLTPSQTVGPTHNLAMSRSPLREEPWAGQGEWEECVGRGRGGLVAGDDREKVSSPPSLGQKGCVCPPYSPWPSGSATGLQERPRRPPQDQGWFTNPRARGGLGWGAGGCGRGGVGKGSGMLTAWKLGPESRGTAKAPGLPG